jgi:FkbM family methyltransferase
MTERDTRADPARGPAKPFVSFSANAEDVILHRLFGNRDNGFYVDVGAAHPVFENDTKALYDRGWSGINIEPNPALFAQLESARPRDRNLALALSDAEGSLPYWEVVGTGLSTCDAEEAERARGKGFEVSEHTVRCTTLARVLSDANVTCLDVLKIDVEGFELRVLRGNDWTQYRPSVIVVEVTYPETPVRRPDNVRPLLERHGYAFAYFDGLNDFFVDQTFRVPGNAFRPSNVFDRVVHHNMVTLREHADALERDRAVKEEYIGSLRAHNAGLERQLVQLQNEAGALRSEIEMLRLDVSGLRARSLREQDEAAQALAAARRHGERVLALGRELEGLRHLSGHRSPADAATQVTDAQPDTSQSEATELRSRLTAVYASRSWRLTRPLRGLSRLIAPRKP